MTLVSVIVAVAENGVIGKENTLPWRLSDDLKNFKALTTGHVIVMGRKTFESFPKPLPNRIHIIITRQEDYQLAYEYCHVVHSLADALTLAKQLEQDEIFIIGGAEIYKQALNNNLVDKIYLTEVKASVEGDAIFPELDKSQWKEQSRTGFTKHEKNDFDFDVVELTKI